MTRYGIGLKTNDIPEDQPIRVDLGEGSIVIIKHAGQLHGMSSSCTHAGGPLEDGQVEGGELVCPIHGARFDVKSGAANMSAQQTSDVQTYKVEADPATGEVMIEA